MIAFEIYVNKVKVCTAGLDDVEFVSAALSSFVSVGGRAGERSFNFSVHGMKNKRMYHWVRYHVQKGNIIEIRIVDAKVTDEPKETRFPVIHARRN